MRISDWSSEVCSSDHATGPVTGPGKETVYSAAAPGYSPPVQSHSVNPAGYDLAHTTAAHQVQAPHPLRHRRGAQYPGRPGHHLRRKILPGDGGRDGEYRRLRGRPPGQLHPELRLDIRVSRSQDRKSTRLNSSH